MPARTSSKLHLRPVPSDRARPELAEALDGEWAALPDGERAARLDLAIDTGYVLLGEADEHFAELVHRMISDLPPALRHRPALGRVFLDAAPGPNAESWLAALATLEEDTPLEEEQVALALARGLSGALDAVRLEGPLAFPETTPAPVAFALLAVIGAHLSASPSRRAGIELALYAVAPHLLPAVRHEALARRWGASLDAFRAEPEATGEIELALALAAPELLG